MTMQVSELVSIAVWHAEASEGVASPRAEVEILLVSFRY